MKNQIFIGLALILSGCSSKPVAPEVRNPKPKVGDCIKSSSGFHGHRIVAILENDGVRIGVDCDEVRGSIECSKSAFDIQSDDGSYVKINCVK